MSFESAINYNTYNKYVNLKNKLRYDYKGINLAVVCAIDFIEIFIDDRKITLRKLAEILFKRLKLRQIKKTFCNYDYLFTSDVPGRKDHEQLIQNIQNDIPNSSYTKLEYYFIPYFNPIRFYKFLKHLRKEEEIRNVFFLQQFYLAAKFTFYARLIDKLEYTFNKMDLDGKRYIPLNSSAYTESALTMYFNNKKVNTFHIFHGFFGNYKQKIANDVVNGDNITAHNILAMSEKQKEDLVRDFLLDKNRISITGHPKYKGLPAKPKLTFKKCLVLNGISTYDESFLSLLPILEEISEETGIEFSIKPHPLSKISKRYDFSKSKINIIDKTIGIKDLLSSAKFDFAITHNTSSYYECLYHGLIAFRWDIETNMQFTGLDDKFASKKELLAKIEAFKIYSDNADVLYNNIKKILEYNIGIGINNYSKEITK